MNLYTVGCSFTHGHGPHECKPYANQLDGVTVNNFGRYDLAWPWQLEPYFDTVINDAHAGTGIQFASRQLYKFLNLINQNVDDWVFVVQVSAFSRRDFLLANNYYGTVANTASAEIPIIHTPTTIDHVDYVVDTETTDILTKYHYYYLNDQIMFSHHVSDLLGLVSVLRALGARYLITGMIDLDYKPESIRKNYGKLLNHYTQHVLGLIPNENMIDSIESHLDQPDCDCYHDSCGHPSKHGHMAFSRYVLDMIKKRCWLN